MLYSPISSLLKLSWEGLPASGCVTFKRMFGQTPPQKEIQTTALELGRQNNASLGCSCSQACATSLISRTRCAKP